jgi:mannose-6-phosphate isomerase-like protein (cupin superfamily)
VWGYTEAMLLNPMVQVHRLSIKPDAWCSRHRHRHRHNAFIVVSGVLHITVEREGGLTDETVLNAGEMTTVDPGLFHRFRTGPEGCECFEVYYPPVLAGEDIERTGQGGSREQREAEQAADVVVSLPLDPGAPRSWLQRFDG